jgi:cold shock protein
MREKHRPSRALGRQLPRVSPRASAAYATRARKNWTLLLLLVRYHLKDSQDYRTVVSYRGERSSLHSPQGIVMRLDRAIRDRIALLPSRELNRAAVRAANPSRKARPLRIFRSCCGTIVPANERIKIDVGNRTPWRRHQHRGTGAAETAQTGSVCLYARGSTDGRRARHGQVVTTLPRGSALFTPDQGGKDIFVHASALDRSGVMGLTDQQRVAVDVTEGRKGRSTQATADLTAAAYQLSTSRGRGRQRARHYCMPPRHRVFLPSSSAISIDCHPARKSLRLTWPKANQLPPLLAGWSKWRLIGKPARWQ